MADLDDIHVFSNSANTLSEISLQMAHIALGLNLNTTKSRTRSHEEVRRTGLKALGSFVDPEDPKLLFLEIKLVSIKNDSAALADLPNQHAPLLPRQSIQLKLRHLAKTMDTATIGRFWHDVDKELFNALRRIRVTTLV